MMPKVFDTLIDKAVLLPFGSKHGYKMAIQNQNPTLLLGVEKGNRKNTFTKNGWKSLQIFAGGLHCGVSQNQNLLRISSREERGIFGNTKQEYLV